MEELKVAPTQIMKALISNYQADKDRALSDLELYLNRPVGVGSHNTVFEDTKKIFETLEHADSMIEFLKNSISEENPNDKK